MAEYAKLTSGRYAPSGAIELIGRSRAIARVQEFVRRAAAGDGGVLMTAEHGSAVEPIVRELHAASRRAAAPYVVVECASTDAAAIERLLFGAQPTGAPSNLESVSAASRIAAARGGVLFLQDVTDLPSAAQARLAQIVRDGEVRVDGSPVATGFRVVASAPPTIEADVDARRFRADLFRRLSSVRIDLPPLRERQEDVPALAARLLDEACAARGVPARSFNQAALALLAALTWPGNLRELREVIDRVAAESTDAVVQIEHLLPALRLPHAQPAFTPSGSLREAKLRFEREYIASVLQHHGWHMASAAETLGIQRPNLYRKARQLGIPLSRATE
jgi:two-component system, NtrC family, nitrogen regulation response regulator NtrX